MVLKNIHYIHFISYISLHPITMLILFTILDISNLTIDLSVFLFFFLRKVGKIDHHFLHLLDISMNQKLTTDCPF